MTLSIMTHSTAVPTLNVTALSKTAVRIMTHNKTRQHKMKIKKYNFPNVATELIRLNAIIPSVIMQSVVAPSKLRALILLTGLTERRLFSL